MSKLTPQQNFAFLSAFENSGVDAAITYLQSKTSDINNLEIYNLYIFLRALAKENPEVTDKEIVDFASRFSNSSNAFRFAIQFCREEKFNLLNDFLVQISAADRTGQDNIKSVVTELLDYGMVPDSQLPALYNTLFTLSKKSPEIRDLLGDLLLRKCSQDRLLIEKYLADNKLEKMFPNVVRLIAFNKNEERKEFIVKNLDKFNKQFGRVDFEAGQLAFAAIQSLKKDKPYEFKPVIFNQKDNPNEFSEFLQFVKENKENLKGKEINFALADGHWVAGSLLVDKNGEVKIAMIDSLGIKNENNPDAWVNPYLGSYLKNINEVFGETVKPFITGNIRQYAPKGCSVYAIDDIQHLFSIKDYLPKNQNVHTYLENNKNTKDVFCEIKGDGPGKIYNEKVSANSIAIKSSKLPLYLMLTRQSVSQGAEAFVNSFPEEERKMTFSKKGHTAHQAAETLIMFSEEKKKKVNTRLEHKLDTLHKKVSHYTATTDMQTMQKDMDSFTLKSFKERVQNPELQQKSRQQKRAHP